MSWLVFTYSLPSKASSSPRVTLWRRLRRLGAIALSGVQVLPDRDDCLEALQWLVQEVRQAKGDALVMRVESFQDMGDHQIVKKFREVRQADYAELTEKVAELEAALADLSETGNPQSHSFEHCTTIREGLEKLYKHYADIQRIDFFDCPEQETVAVRIQHLSQALRPVTPDVRVTPVAIADYRDVPWRTRPQPHVDRLACIWLIRRFINPAAIIRYGKTPQDGEVAFDMDSGKFQHQGNLCTFEVMAKAFEIEDAGLQVLEEIVHEIDLRDGLYLHPQMAGIDAILRGWLLGNFTDAELEAHGIALFEGLYTDCLKSASKARSTTTIAPKNPTREA